MNAALTAAAEATNKGGPGIPAAEWTKINTYLSATVSGIPPSQEQKWLQMLVNEINRLNNKIAGCDCP